jgi:transposase-like protein
MQLAERLANAGDGDFLRGVAEAVLPMQMGAAPTPTCVSARTRIVSVAATIAMPCDAEGRLEIVGLHIGPSEAETFWAAFLKSLVMSGLRGVKLVVSDAHEGLKAAIARVLGAAWQGCRVHWMRNALAHVRKAQQSMASAALRQAFLRPDQQSARQTWRHVADQLRPRGRGSGC